MNDSTDSTEYGVSPFDTAASAITRFLIELIAWIAGPLAAVEVLGSVWWALPASAVLVGLPAVFNTRGDKKATGIPTPGPLRIAIEMVLLVVAIAAAWTVWPPVVAIVVTVLGVAMLVTGGPRYRWLAAGAPPTRQAPT